MIIGQLQQLLTCTNNNKALLNKRNLRNDEITSSKRCPLILPMGARYSDDSVGDNNDGSDVRGQQQIAMTFIWSQR